MRANFTTTMFNIVNGMTTKTPINDPSFASLKLLTSSVITGGMGGVNFQDPEIQNVYMKPTAIEIRYGRNINTIRLHLSDGVNEQVTDWHGGTGGDSTATYNIPAGKRVAKAQMWIQDVVNGLRFINDDGTYSPTYGEKNGDFYEVEIFGYLTGFQGRSGEAIDSLGFISNEYSYDPANPKTVPYATLLYGGTGGDRFQDQQALTTWGSPSSLQLKSGSLLDNIMLSASGNSHGGSGGGSPVTISTNGLQAIRIHSGADVDALEFKVNNQWSQRYGGSGGSASTINVPSDATLIGIYGKSGTLVDSIGFIFARQGSFSMILI